jgi:hypothetical protein
MPTPLSPEEEATINKFVQMRQHMDKNTASVAKKMDWSKVDVRKDATMSLGPIMTEDMFKAYRAKMGLPPPNPKS